MRKLLSALLSAAVIWTSPGLGVYEALAGSTRDGVKVERLSPAEFPRAAAGANGNFECRPHGDPVDFRSAEAAGDVGLPAGPDGVYFGGLYTEAGLLLKQSRELGLKSAFISGDGAKTDSIYAISGDAADGAYMTMVGVPVEYLPEAKGFVERYHKRYPSPDTPIKPYDHFTYEAAQIVFSAMDKVGADRAKLLETLPKTHYQGMLGLTTFDQKGDTLNRIITMTKANFKTHSFEPLR